MLSKPHEYWRWLDHTTTYSEFKKEMWGKEKCCKSRPQMGQFWAVLVRMEDRREGSDRKIVSQCCEPVRRVYYRAVVEVKKEIPVKWQ